jgi:hypothetical protein
MELGAFSSRCVTTMREEVPVAMPVSSDQRSDVSNQSSLWMADYPDGMEAAHALGPSPGERNAKGNPVLDITLRVTEEE